MYRDLELLRESGYALDVATVNGEARYRLSGSNLAHKGATPSELAALALAQRALRSVAGTGPVRELERLARTGAGVEPAPMSVRIAPIETQADPEILRTIDTAITSGRKLRLRYRGDKDLSPRERIVHPVELYVADQQPYLVAWDESRAAIRTFKVVRVTRAALMRERARVPAQGSDPSGDKASSVKVWSGEPVDVRVRILAPASRYVLEWPLVAGQSLRDAPKGAVDVVARVRGLEETVRWVLRWGANAIALEPPALRARVADELRRALASYGPSKVSQDREKGGRVGR